MISPYYWRNFRVKVSLNWINKLWWKFMPGTTIKVKWPVGEVVVDSSMHQWDWTLGTEKHIIESADPNDHYRPWMEKYVGKQGWDWDWSIKDNDITEDKLTIKFRKGKERWASYAVLKWG